MGTLRLLTPTLVVCDILSVFLSTLKAYSQGIAFVSSQFEFSSAVVNFHS